MDTADGSVFFTLSSGKDGINRFREGVSKQDVRASLRAGRAHCWTGMPTSRQTG